MAGDWRSKIHSPVNDVMSVQTPIKNKYFYEHAQTVFVVTVQSAVKLKRALNVLSPDVCSICCVPGCWPNLRGSGAVKHWGRVQLYSWGLCSQKY